MAKKETQEQEASDLLKKSEISLWIDDYDDIFSVFDPRPYSQRAISEDLLAETKRASRDKTSGQVELKFLVPKNMREVFTEKTIKSRIKENFKKSFLVKKKEYKKFFSEGIFFIFLGVIFMALATFILIKQAYSSMIITFLSVLLEPAGWFLFWEGLNQVIFERRKKLPEFDFYKKMSTADISFFDY